MYIFYDQVRSEPLRKIVLDWENKNVYIIQNILPG